MSAKVQDNEGNVITVTTYQELDLLFLAFRDTKINLLIVCSRGGLGKSETARSILDQDQQVFIGGHETPLDLFKKLFDGRGKLVIFGELDGTLSNARIVGLLKQLCETREEKEVMWGSTDRRLDEIGDGTGVFTTTSRVLILCNSFSVLNANVAALKTRGLAVQFSPSSREILDKIKTFAEDGQILDFLEQVHESIVDFNLRTYGVLEELKRAGLHWRKYALQEPDPVPKVQEIAGLLVRFNLDTERIKHYSGSRRDYYNWKSEAVAYMRRQAVKAAACGPRCHQVPDDHSASSADNGHEDSKGSRSES